MTSQPTYTDEAKRIMTGRLYKSAILNLAKENNVKPVDLDRESLKAIGVTATNMKLAVDAVVEIITEFYGIKLWELNQGADVKTKYSMEDSHYRMLIDEGNVNHAYAQYAKQFKGEGENADKYDGQIPSQQKNADIGGHKEVLKQFRNTERGNLKRMIANEKDPKKKELYETQLKTLDLKEEIDG